MSAIRTVPWFFDFVPPFALDGELFRGEDATARFVRCAASGAWPSSPEIRRIGAQPVGIRRD